MTVFDRIEARIEKVPEAGCWIFTGAIQKDGYGVIQNGLKLSMVHRLMYENRAGGIPPGLVIDHRCRVPSCCNPSHLQAVTQSVNIKRGRLPSIIGRLNGSKTHCPHGHPYSGRNLIERVVNGSKYRYCRECRASRNAIA